MDFNKTCWKPVSILGSYFDEVTEFNNFAQARNY